MKLSPALKVGILAILSIIILIFSLLWLKGRTISIGDRIEVQFNDIDGMRPGCAVQMMGIRVGQVEEVIPVITKDENFVKVRFVILEPNLIIPRASEISIQQSGIIGEKFLEVTPPKVTYVNLPYTEDVDKIIEKAPVELLVDGKYTTVGEVKYFEIVDSRTLSKIQQQECCTDYVYKLGYVIKTPGIIIPKNSKEKLVKNADNTYKFEITPPTNLVVKAPDITQKYTIIEPTRMKEFFDLQIQTAEALKETNAKINQVLTEEAIEDLKDTISNTKSLTAEAAIVFDEASDLIVKTKDDFGELISLSTKLSKRMITLSDNVNNIVTDPEVKTTMIETINTIQESADQICTTLQDSKFADTLTNVNVTSKNLTEITKTINGITQEEDFKKDLNVTVKNLNKSLEQLTITLKSVNNLTDNQQNKLKVIIDDSAEITGNLKTFSKRLNKRFAIFRLML